MKKIIFLFIGLFLLTCLSARAQYFEGFSVKSYKISSVWPTSFRSVKGSVTATVGNTKDARLMSGIRATVYRNGVRFAEGTCEDVTIAVGTHSYVFRGQVWLADGISTWDAIKAALSFNASEYTVDFVVDISHPDGTVDHVVRKDMPVIHYLRRR